jgi:hypothetical protein
MRFLWAGILLPVISFGAIWPDNIGAWKRTAASEATLTDKPIWDEYGLQSAEAATYESQGQKFSATAWQLHDTTASLAAFDWLRPAQAKPSKVASLAAETAEGLLLVHGNYLIRFDNYKPVMAELATLAESLHNVDSTPLPTLPGYLPPAGLVPNSERYVLGPASLQRFEPEISPSVAGFHLGTEAQIGVFHNPKGDLKLAIFDYPTPQIAMEKVEDFAKVPGAMAKRSGPMVAVILNPADRDAAERLLAQVRYVAEVTRNERVPTRKDNIGDLVVNAFSLIGILLAFATFSGLMVGGLRAISKRRRPGEDTEGMITLHLADRG